jgi:hypothetical protein
VHRPGGWQRQMTTRGLAFWQEDVMEACHGCACLVRSERLVRLVARLE